MYLQERKIREVHGITAKDWDFLTCVLNKTIWYGEVVLVWDNSIRKTIGFARSEDLRTLYQSIKNIKVPVYVLRPENYNEIG